jgi:hypothetical protein
VQALAAAALCGTSAGVPEPLFDEMVGRNGGGQADEGYYGPVK